MPAHIMLSYQWDDQALVTRIYERLREDGLPVWMDIRGGVSGNINDSMAAGVEEAVVICPFMTPEYQASRSCKKELNYADGRELLMVPVMLTNNWEATEWLGLITAGLLWVDFRDAEKDEEHFDMCVRSLEEEIMFNAGHLLTLDETPREEQQQEEEQQQQEEEEEEQQQQQRRPGPALKPSLRKKPGRGFRHAVSDLYIHDSDEEILHPSVESRKTVGLSETAGEHSYWEEVKKSGCKYFRNVATNRFLGLDPSGVHSEVSPSESEEWFLLVDQSDHSHRRAVVIKNKESGSFLAVRGGRLTGLAAYTQECKWFLE